jgi:hypothetical protein
MRTCYDPTTDARSEPLTSSSRSHNSPRNHFCVWSPGNRVHSQSTQKFDVQLALDSCLGIEGVTQLPAASF